MEVRAIHRTQPPTAIEFKTSVAPLAGEAPLSLTSDNSGSARRGSICQIFGAKIAIPSVQDWRRSSSMERSSPLGARYFQLPFQTFSAPAAIEAFSWLSVA